MDYTIDVKRNINIVNKKNKKYGDNLCMRAKYFYDYPNRGGYDAIGDYKMLCVDDMDKVLYRLTSDLSKDNTNIQRSWDVITIKMYKDSSFYKNYYIILLSGTDKALTYDENQGEGLRLSTINKEFFWRLTNKKYQKNLNDRYSIYHTLFEDLRNQLWDIRKIKHNGEKKTCISTSDLNTKDKKYVWCIKDEPYLIPDVTVSEGFEFVRMEGSQNKNYNMNDGENNINENNEKVRLEKNRDGSLKNNTWLITLFVLIFLMIGLYFLYKIYKSE
jgi:hypothetical protein